MTPHDAAKLTRRLNSMIDTLAKMMPRRCENQKCYRFFSPFDPRQAYCSAECSNVVRQERHAPKRKLRRAQRKLDA